MRRGFVSIALALGALTACQPAPRSDAAVSASAAEAPAHREAPPPTPEGAGSIRQILAIDGERAIVVFTRQGAADTPPPILAAMRADGSIDWTVAIDGQPLIGRTSTGIELVEDAVSIAIARPGEENDRLDRIEIYGVDDGALRSTVRPAAEIYARDTIADRGLRVDTLVSGEPGASEIIATDRNGPVWRTKLPGAPDTEIVVLAHHIAVRVAVEDDEAWHVFDRVRGSKVAVVPGYAGCSDGEHWFVGRGAELHAVDLTAFSTKVVLDTAAFPRRLPSFGRQDDDDDEWMLRDCTIVDGRPLAFAQLGMIEALVGVDQAGGWQIQPLGIRRYREGSVDPLPDRLHPRMVLGGLDESDAYDLISADLHLADRTGSNAPATWLGAQGTLIFDDADQHGYVVATREVLGVIDGATGVVLGHHLRTDTMALHRTQRAGRHLWLPPAAGTRLGAAKPTVLDLGRPTDDATIRGALPAALGADRRGKPAVSCDAASFAGYDGVETSAGLGPVAPSREPPWSAELLAQGARRFACASASSIVTPLAWAIVEDSRPLRNHYALMMVEDRVEGRTVYTVVDMYRHATNRDWNISTSFHDPSSPLRRYLARPTTADLDAFIDQSSFALVDRFGALLAGNVLDTNWSAVTGELPLRRFPPAIEQVD